MKFFKRKRTFEQFVNQIEDLDLIRKYATTTNQIAGVTFPDLTFLPYQELKVNIPELLEEGKIGEVLERIIRAKEPNIKKKLITQESHYIRLRFLFWVQDQYKAIQQLEIQYLNSPPDQKMLAAGIRELDILGDINLIDDLAEGDILKWEAIRQLPYEQIFNKQLRTVIYARINKRIAKEKNP